MDIQMPVMNGIEATHEILKYEKSENTTHTPIIAVTANAMRGDEKRSLEAGCDGYIQKPIDIDILTAQIERYRRR